MEDRFSPFVKNLIVLKGGTGQKERKQIAEMMDSIPEDEERLIIATGRYLGEGFDDARLDTLFLALPVSWRGTLSQYAGRLHRLHDMKGEIMWSGKIPEPDLGDRGIITTIDLYTFDKSYSTLSTTSPKCLVSLSSLDGCY